MEWRAVLAVVLSIFVLLMWQYVFSPSSEPPQQAAPPETATTPARPTGAPPAGVLMPSQPHVPPASKPRAAQPADPQTWSERLHTAIFTPSVSQLSVTERRPAGTVDFEYQDPSGWRVRKSLQLQYGTYAIEMGATVMKPDGEPVPPLAEASAREQLVTLENDLIHLVMTTRGARVKELLLKQYPATRLTTPNLVLRWDFLWGGSAPSNPPVPPTPGAALVNLIAAGEEALPLGIEVSADGRHALLRWGPGLHTDLEGNGSYGGPLSFINGERWLDQPKAGQPPIERTGTLQWTSLQDKYYTVAFIPHSDTPWGLLHQGTTPVDYAIGLRWPLSEPVTEARFTIYAGPKEIARLAAFDGNGKSLAELVYYNYGWVRMFRPDMWLLRPLQWLYRVTHNYGIAIIIITVIVKLLFYPLSVKSFKSMQAMQRLQPQMKRLQDMYKQDRQKLNEEMMKLYREQKVNPMGGCLPMVVQIPVFIALYQVLYTSIELRQAPFMLWIQDLSAPDHPMAIIMGASMVIQQWMTPTTGDPRQAKMMLFMPIIFTFMFLNFPVGLVIYWLVNNLLTIAQQYVMLRRN